MTHELTHFQQAMTMGGQKYISLYRQPNNMLELCLREGGAEFVTSLVLNDITQSKSLGYLEQHESELKQKFVEDLAAQDQTYWLWESVGKADQPKLLGYVMGYKICQSYYRQAPDKSAALKAVLLMEDARQFAESSGYFVAE